MSWLQEHFLSIVGVVAIVAVLWALAKSWKQGAKTERARGLTVYCLHCNWEGRVDRVRPTCGRCGSHQLSMLAM